MYRKCKGIDAFSSSITRENPQRAYGKPAYFHPASSIGFSKGLSRFLLGFPGRSRMARGSNMRFVDVLLKRLREWPERGVS